MRGQYSKTQFRAENDRIIGTYRVEKTLGQGTFGKVKLGIHIHTNQKVAIKILEKKKIKDVNDVERVQREIHILKIVRHPNIVQLYEIIETQSKLYLIMEHCCNGELFDYITSKNRLKEEEACRIFQQLISGIEYLGELGIAHRDIKPENLLLDDFKNLKIVDFGLSNTFRPGEKLQTACGSPCYAAPELIRGKEYIGPKADLWSAGVVLYAEVCGYLPFEDQNTQSLYQKILKADFQLPQFLSKESKDLVLHVLVPDPDLRYGIKQIKQHKWFNIYKPPKELDKGIRVGIDEQIIYHNVLKEMNEKSGINERYVRQCIEANRHNSSTSYYYLLVKHKILNGEELLTNQPNAPKVILTEENAIMASSQFRLHKSVTGNRTTKSNAKQLRKIAEGLGDLNIVRFQQSSLEHSLDPSRSKLSKSKSPKSKVKTLQITAPTLQDPDLPNYGDYDQINTTVLKRSDVNRSLDNSTPHAQPLVSTTLNESQTISSFTRRIKQGNQTNRIRINTKFKVNPVLDKSQTYSLYGTQVSTGRHVNLNRFKRMDSINKSNILRIESNNNFPREPNLGLSQIATPSLEAFNSSKNRKLSVNQQKIFESMNIQENSFNRQQQMAQNQTTIIDPRQLRMLNKTTIGYTNDSTRSQSYSKRNRTIRMKQEMIGLYLQKERPFMPLNNFNNNYNLIQTRKMQSALSTKKYATTNNKNSKL